MSRLATVYLPELNLRHFGHLKGVFQSCLAQFNPKESVNLHSNKNRT